MLIDVETGRMIDRIPYRAQFDALRGRLSDVESDQMVTRINELIGEAGAEIATAGLPDELRVERGVAWVAHGRGPLLFGAGKRLELGGGDVRPTVRRVRVGTDRRRLGLEFVSHRLRPTYLEEPRCHREPSRAAMANARK